MSVEAKKMQIFFFAITKYDYSFALAVYDNKSICFWGIVSLNIFVTRH